MKNFIIGLMLGAWAGPTVKEITRKTVVNLTKKVEDKA